jgi:cytochrome c551/c552
MQPKSKTSACGTIGALATLTIGLIAGSPAVSIAAGSDTMPVTQQNALVQKYCVACHTDASKDGGLSLQHFDASHLDPSLAAMMLSKVRDAGAIGASGIPLPDKTTQEALVSALTDSAVGANAWNVTQTQDWVTHAPILGASIVREAPLTSKVTELYRLTLTCHLDTHDAEMQLSWAPYNAQRASVMSSVVDGGVPFVYNLEGAKSEKMGNGVSAANGPASIMLYSTKEHAGTNLVQWLPLQTLTIRNVFPNHTVVFPLDDLTPAARQGLSTCFAERSFNR